MGIHDGGDALPDAGKGEFLGAEGIDSDLVGCVKNRGQGATAGTRAAGEIERGKVGAARCFKFEFRQGLEIERAQATLEALWPSERILDGEAHVGPAELGEHRAVGEFDHRVDDALWMNHDVDAFHADAKKPASFDHFQAFVEQGCRVDGDLRAHFPGRVLEGLGESDLCDLIGG